MTVGQLVVVDRVDSCGRNKEANVCGAAKSDTDRAK